MIFNYNLKAIFIDDSNSINGLNINENTFETTSSDSNNTPLSYNAVTLNCIITECINNGSPLRISDDIIIKNCVNIINNKTFTAGDIPINTTTQNNSNNGIQFICNKDGNSICIEITKVGPNNVLKLYHLSGNEQVTKDVIKKIIIHIGF